MKPKLIVIVGPTAAGKSELAVKIAKKFKGEIISADSRQIYHGLDVGTGKVPGRWTGKIFLYKKIPHYCLDFVPPQKQYSVAEYKNCAQKALQNITDRHKLPLLIGGTGFWIDAVVYNFALPAVRPNPRLRLLLGKKSAKELLALLRRLDPQRARTIEQKNPRRLIRAIEIAKTLGKVPILRKKNIHQTLWIGLKPKDLVKRIGLRVKKTIKSGLAAETKKLLQAGVKPNRIKELGFEYQAALLFINNKINKQEFEQKLIKDSLAYARRQMAWFKRNPAIHWFTNGYGTEKLCQEFLQ